MRGPRGREELGVFTRGSLDSSLLPMLSVDNIIASSSNLVIFVLFLHFYFCFIPESQKLKWAKC